MILTILLGFGQSPRRRGQQHNRAQQLHVEQTSIHSYFEYVDMYVGILSAQRKTILFRSQQHWTLRGCAGHWPENFSFYRIRQPPAPLSTEQNL
jgi:hypothetical protein